MIDDPAPRPLHAALASARAAIADLVDQLESVPPQDLAGLLMLVDELGAAAAGVRVAVAAAAVSHGVPAAAGQRTREWLADHAPSLRQGGLAPVAKLADELTRHRAELSTCAQISADHPRGIVWPDATQGRVLPALAVGVLDEIDRLTPRLVEAAIPTVTRALVDLGVDAGLSSMRRLRPALLARYGQTGELERVHAALATHARLSAPRVESAELTEYRLAMTPEQAAILEAAIGPLSAPQPNPETGERDLRSSGSDGWKRSPRSAGVSARAAGEVRAWRGRVYRVRAPLARRAPAQAPLARRQAPAPALETVPTRAVSRGGVRPCTCWSTSPISAPRCAHGYRQPTRAMNRRCQPTGRGWERACPPPVEQPRCSAPGPPTRCCRPRPSDDWRAPPTSSRTCWVPVASWSTSAARCGSSPVRNAAP